MAPASFFAVRQSIVPPRSSVGWVSTAELVIHLFAQILGELDPSLRWDDELALGCRLIQRFLSASRLLSASRFLSATRLLSARLFVLALRAHRKLLFSNRQAL